MRQGYLSAVGAAIAMLLLLLVAHLIIPYLVSATRFEVCR